MRPVRFWAMICITVYKKLSNNHKAAVRTL